LSIYYEPRTAACRRVERATTRATIAPVPRQESALPFDESTSFGAPAAFGPYRVLHQIGSGVLGPVFRTYEPQRDRLVAVKAFKLDIVPEDVARLADALRRLVAAGLSHPNLVTLRDAGLEGTTAYLAMDYIAGETLDVALRHISPAPLDRALPVLTRVAEALDAGWAAGHGHGALHPRDIFMDPGSADVLLTGVGVVPALESIGVKPAVRRQYAAPERLDPGGTWDVRADVYSLGAIAHELLTRRRPAGPGEQDGSLAQGLSPEQRVVIRRILASALAERPSDRFASASAFVQALGAVARGDDPGPLPIGWSELADESRAPALATPLLAGLDDPPPPLPPVEPPATAPELETLVFRADAFETAQHDEAASATEVMRAIEPKIEEAREAARADELAYERWRAAADAEAARSAEDAARGETVEEADEATSEDADTPSVEAAEHERPPVSPPAPATDLELRPPAPEIVPSGSRLVAPPTFLASDPPPARYPWAALIAIGLGALAIGALGGYSAGLRQGRASLTSGAATPAPAATSTATPPAPAPGDTEVRVTPPPTPPPTSTPDPAVPAPAPLQTTPPAPVRGAIAIKSVPAGATILVDGRLRGNAPQTVDDLRLGTHTVQAARQGYRSVSRKVTLTSAKPQADVTLTLSATEPAARTGSVFVDTRPRGARVTLDGRVAGVTPLRLPRVAAGSHAVRIELAGYRTVTSTLVVKGGEQAPLAVTLERIAPLAALPAAGNDVGTHFADRPGNDSRRHFLTRSPR
jgi:serine/threonine-protein kinase